MIERHFERRGARAPETGADDFERHDELPRVPMRCQGLT